LSCNDVSSVRLAQIIHSYGRAGLMKHSH